MIKISLCYTMSSTNVQLIPNLILHKYTRILRKIMYS